MLSARRRHGMRGAADDDDGGGDASAAGGGADRGAAAGVRDDEVAISVLQSGDAGGAASGLSLDEASAGLVSRQSRREQRLCDPRTCSLCERVTLSRWCFLLMLGVLMILIITVTVLVTQSLPPPVGGGSSASTPVLDVDALVANAPSTSNYTALAEWVLTRCPLIDGHNDLPWELRSHGGPFSLDLSVLQPALHTDIVRLRRGHVGGQFWSVWVPCANGTGPVLQVLEQIDVAKRMIAHYPDTFELVTNASAAEAAFRRGKIASLIGAEGGHAIDSSPQVLRMLYDLGVRYMTLTHSCNTPWADNSYGPDTLGGLSSLGRSIVREMNRIGMMVDISHVSFDTMRDVLDISVAPVLFSHSGAYAVCNHTRNAPDDVLHRMPENGGVVMVNFYPLFVKQQVFDEYRRLVAEGASNITARMREFQARSADRCRIDDVVAHIRHIARVASVDNVGLGGDFDGIPFVTDGLESVANYVELAAALLDPARGGFTVRDVCKMAGLNVLRTLRGAERVAGGRAEPLTAPMSAVSAKASV